MTNNAPFHYPCASFTDTQLPLLRVAALYFGKLAILAPVGPIWATKGEHQNE